MAGSVNKVILVGNLGKDPEIRTTQDGQKIVNLTLATSETWNDRQSGERRRFDVQRGVRPHPQSMEHGADLGRLDRRRRRRARCRRGLARARLRPRGKPAPARHLLRGRRLAAVARPGHARYFK